METVRFVKKLYEIVRFAVFLNTKRIFITGNSLFRFNIGHGNGA